MQTAGFSKTHGSAQDGGPSQMPFACLQNNGFVERLVAMPIAFADKNPQQDGFVWDLHVQLSFID